MIDAVRQRLRETLTRYLVPTPDHPDHPSYAGAVVLVAVDGATTAREAVGDALRYAPGPVELPPAERVLMRYNSIFDLASITKVFTSVLVMQQVEAGRLALDDEVGDLDGVTVGMLLAHTSGLPAVAPVADLPQVRLVARPGTEYRYSDVGMIVLGRLLERVTSTRLDALLEAGITGPLGLPDTGFRPLRPVRLGAPDAARRPRPVVPSERLVATEAKPGRGLVRGTVHDENAHALGGIAGHAGIFGTADDLAVFGQALLDGRLLAGPMVRAMIKYRLGVVVDQPSFMGRLASPVTFGHTGFTGTSLVVDARRRIVLVLLTNRVHPDRAWGGVNEARVAVANVVADETLDTVP